MRDLFLLLSLTYWLTTPSFCIAEENKTVYWSVTGFGTLGYTDAKKYGDRTPRRNVYQNGYDIRKNGYLLDSRLGLQILGEIGDHWDFLGQAVLRHQYETDIKSFINMAFIRYQASNNWQIALGRHPFDLFFLSDHRNIGYSYDWVRPPTEFYGYLPYDFFDGVKVTREWGDFESAWRWNLSVGNIDGEFESDVQEPDGDGDTSSASPIYNTELTWQSDTWQFRANYALLEFKQDIGDANELQLLAQEFGSDWPDINIIADEFGANTSMKYAAVGLAWQPGDWKFKTEVSHISTDFVQFDGNRAYFHIARRLNEWLPFLTLGYARDDSKLRFRAPVPDPELQEIYEDVVEEVTSFRHNQKSITLGVRWDVASKRAVKVQCEKYYFEANSASIHGRIDEAYLENEDRSWCSFSFDWTF